MKKLLAAMFVALLMVGCGESSTPKAIDLDDPATLDRIIAEAIDWHNLKRRGKKGEKLRYALNEQTPYTGWAKRMLDDGQVKQLTQFKDGKRDGLITHWYKNGQKKSEANRKDGELMSDVAWKPNGEKCPVTNVKDGNGVSVFYYENGKKQMERNYKDGKLVTSFAWKPNGKKCPVTNVANGNGVQVWYNKDGKESFRDTFKYGERFD